MVLSTNTLRNIQYVLFFSASLLIGMLLNETLYKVSLATQTNSLNAATYELCNGTICQTVISRK